MNKLTVALMFVLPVLSACGKTSSVQGAYFPGQSVYTMSDVLNNRDICKDTVWEEIEDDYGYTVVVYRCTYVGAQEYYAGRHVEVDLVEEYHQWTLSDSGPVYLSGGVMYWLPDNQDYQYRFLGTRTMNQAFDDAYDNENTAFADIARRGYVPDISVVQSVTARLARVAKQ